MTGEDRKWRTVATGVQVQGRAGKVRVRVKQRGAWRWLPTEFSAEQIDQATQLREDLQASEPEPESPKWRAILQWGSDELDLGVVDATTPTEALLEARARVARAAVEIRSTDAERDYLQREGVVHNRGGLRRSISARVKRAPKRGET